MDRRNFLRNLLIGGISTAAARQFPFRVFSFPTEIVAPSSSLLEASIESIELEAFAKRIPDLVFAESNIYHLFKNRAIPFPPSMLQFRTVNSENGR